MEPAKVGIREFRHNFGDYAESSKPIAVTKHGRTVGLYFPMRPKATEEDLEKFRKAGEALQKQMKELGVTEDQLVEHFKALRKEKKRRV